MFSPVCGTGFSLFVVRLKPDPLVILRVCEYADLLATASCIRRELHLAIDQREDRVIPSKSNVLAWVEARASLAQDDRARLYDFTVVALYAETAAPAIAAVS